MCCITAHEPYFKVEIGQIYNKMPKQDVWLHLKQAALDFQNKSTKKIHC